MRARLTSALLAAALAAAGCGRSASPRPRPIEPIESDAGGNAPGTESGATMLSNLLDLGHHGVKTFAFDAARRRLFVSFDDVPSAEIDSGGDRLYQWDIPSATLLHTYAIEAGWLVDALFVQEGSARVVVRLYRPRSPAGAPWSKYILLDPDSGAVLSADLGLHDDRSAEVRFDPAGHRFSLTTSGLSGKPPQTLAFDAAGKPLPGAPEIPPRPKGRLWIIESSKATLDTHGLYYTDEAGQSTRVTPDQWQDNFALTRDGRYVVTTTWGGEVLVFSTAEKRIAYREKVAQSYGHLAYDPQGDRFLIGDALQDGTTFLRQLVLAPPL